MKCEKRRSQAWRSKAAQNAWNRSLFHFDDGLTESKKSVNNGKEIIYMSSRQNDGEGEGERERWNELHMSMRDESLSVQCSDVNSYM